MAPGTASTMTGASRPSVRSSTWRGLGDGGPGVDAVGAEAGEVDGGAWRSVVGAGQLEEVVDERAQAVGLLDRGVELGRRVRRGGGSGGSRGGAAAR